MVKRRIFVIVCLSLLAGCARRGRMACRTFPDQADAVCEQAGDGAIVVAAESVAKLSFGGDGLATMLTGERDLYFVDRQGRTARAFLFDNGADYFVEGLARTVKGGKIGFVNTKLETVVPPRWDFALPFEHGAARVCTGCTVGTGEHAEVSGGKWGYADRQGKVVVPVTYDLAQLPARW